MVDLSLNRSLLRLVFTQTTRFLAGTFFANFAKHRLQPTTFTYPRLRIFSKYKRSLCGLQRL